MQSMRTPQHTKIHFFITVNMQNTFVTPYMLSTKENKESSL